MKNLFTKPAFTILLLLAGHLCVIAQNECRLSETGAPLLLNLKIRMPPEQVQATFGKDLKIKIKKKGERTFFQNFIKNPAPNSLNGARALYLRFFDGKLYQVEVFYEPRPDLDALEKIAKRLSSQLNFAASDWQIKNKRAEIACGELTLVADNVLNPRIEFTDEKIRSTIEAMREKKSGRK